MGSPIKEVVFYYFFNKGGPSFTARFFSSRVRSAIMISPFVLIFFEALKFFDEKSQIKATCVTHIGRVSNIIFICQEGIF